MTKQLSTPLTYADSVDLRERIRFHVNRVREYTIALRHELPKGPALTHVDQDVTGADGKITRVRVPLKRSGRQPPHVDGPRYEPEAIDAELAMILYREAIALGLYTFGAEALLLRALREAEEEIARLGGHPSPAAEIAAAALEAAR